ncbi:glycosyltransferase family 4 protein [Bowmanella pacifica]|uniref:Glycosyl transferase n=1 Tax=Bowmanella pacifica TaxID=502051 RepID=A0A917YS75_9ALTE|nr:glycosyltransferase family 4 protein [Bowmanella pacifica]GGO64766.1 glycosyl transferase [Bowmanella pacifica]
MKVIQAHCFYRQRGGEDVVVEREALLLQESGVSLLPWHLNNPASPTAIEKLSLALGTLWQRKVRQQLATFPVSGGDILHVHNFFPLLSPSVFHYAKRQGLKTVLTLHNFRSLTPSAMLPDRLIDYSWCHSLQQCWQGAYQDSKLASLVVAGMIELHRWRKTWLHQVDAFICPSEFVRQQYLKAGFPADKLRVIPHFCPDPRAGNHSPEQGERTFALFVGRNAPEKGLHRLLEAWQEINFPLVIAGADRPRTGKVPANVRFVGISDASALGKLYAEASLLIVPSQVAETFGNVVIEGFSHATPVLASPRGALQELVQPGINGEWIALDSLSALASQIKQLLAEPAHLRHLGHMARQRYEHYYTPEAHADQLMRLYKELHQGQGSTD